MTRNPTKEQVLAYRKEHGVGMMEAVSALQRLRKNSRLLALQSRLNMAHDCDLRDELIELIDILLEST